MSKEIDSHSQNPNNQEQDNRIRREVAERAILLERWRNAEERPYDYPAGEVTDSEGNILYEYEAGTRLYMRPDPERPPEEVMDTCQTPWAHATVDRAFETLGNKRDVQVLERGFGIGLVATRIMEYLRVRGGSYTVIELNRGDADYARLNWTNRQRNIDREIATSRFGGTYNGSAIPIEIIEGDAYEETQKLLEKGRKFDIIVSDTYPLSPQEQGINDLIDLETLKRCLNPDGVFTFFGYFTGSTGRIGSVQRDMVNEHFEEYSVSEAIVNPPPDYRYLNPSPEVIIRRLPVIICRQPKL